MLGMEEIRFECLRLARSEYPSSLDAPFVVKRARAYADFVLGKEESPQPIQAQPATPESAADPHIAVNPGHEGAGYVSPPTT